MLADRAIDEPPDLSPWPILAWAGAIAAITALLSFQGLAWWLIRILYPYPLFVVLGAAFAAWIAAQSRRAPAGLDVGPRLAWHYWTARYAILIATIFLLAAWAFAALTGAPRSPTLFVAFLLSLLFGVMIGFAVQGVVDAMRAVRGSVGTGS